MIYGFWEGGYATYCNALLVEYLTSKNELASQLAASTDEQTRLELKEQLKMARRNYKERLRRAKRSIY
jgi:hypothetical protein